MSVFKVVEIFNIDLCFFLVTKMETFTDQLFSEEVQEFIQDVLIMHKDEPLSTQPVSAHGRSDRRMCLVPSIIVWDPLQQAFNGVLNCMVCESPLKYNHGKMVMIDIITPESSIASTNLSCL